jgi:hypothetical protein
VDLRDSILGFRARQRFDAHLGNLGLTIADDHQRVDVRDVEWLPSPAQRYLRFMAVIGRPRDRSVRARFRGQFRMKPGKAWMPYDSWQYDSVDPITRVVDVRIDLAGLVPMFATDTYRGGAGRMHGTLLGLFTVADGIGPEFDAGELVTWVNDAVMLAPSMLLAPGVRWKEVDDNAFDLVVTDHGNTVTARILVDALGRLVEFRTEDRWYAGTTPPRRAMWITPVDGFTALPDGRPVPTGGSTTWHLPDGEFTYVRGAFDSASLEFNIAP